jgi:hypothetical protein
MEMLVRQLMVRQCVVQIRHLLVDVILVVVQQILDELNLDAVLTFPDVAVHQLDVAVDVELRHQLKMDYYLDVVGAELRYPLRMDYYPDVVQVLVALLSLLQLFLQHEFWQLRPLQLRLALVAPSAR